MTGRFLALAAALCTPLLATPVPARTAIPLPDVATLPHISITTFGHGAPLVLIPGLASPRAVWDGVAPDLARTHRVFLVQVNGFAGEEPGANLKPGLLDGVVAPTICLIPTYEMMVEPVECRDQAYPTCLRCV